MTNKKEQEAPDQKAPKGAGKSTRTKTAKTAVKASKSAKTDTSVSVTKSRRKKSDTPVEEGAKAAPQTAEEKSEKSTKKSNKSGASREKKTRKTNSKSFLNTEADNKTSEKEEKAVAVAPKTVKTVAPAAALLFQAPDFSAVAPAPAKVESGSVSLEENESSKGRTRTKVTRERKRAKVEDKNDGKNKDTSVEASEIENESGESTGRTRNRRNRTEATEKEKASAKKETKKAEKKDLSKPVSAEPESEAPAEAEESTSRRRRRRRERTNGEGVMEEVTALKGSTRLEAKRQRRREGRRESRRQHSISESEFLARRESVDRKMLVREQDGLNQIAVLEDGILVEHYVSRHTQSTIVGSVFLGRVQNVLPSMEAAFVDIGRGRNAVLYSGEVNWDAAGMKGKPRKIEDALKSGDAVLVQATKDPIGHKGARLTSQITLAGRYLVLVPGGTMTGISRKLPEAERARLKKVLKQIVPSGHGVIVRTAAEGASEEQLAKDIERMLAQWQKITDAEKTKTRQAPILLHGEPELALRVVRDIFNEDFAELIVAGKNSWQSVSDYVSELSPDLMDRVKHWNSEDDLFAAHRVDEQLTKGMDRKVWLPSGGSLVIDRTEAMTVIDVNTGRFTGEGGTLEETVTKNNLEAAEEIVRQLRLRDIGGIIVIDFVDMVLESNRDLVLRRLVECLGRDRTRHQVTEITSLGLVQMTRKRVGQGLVEAFSTPCEHCEGRGFVVHSTPVEKGETTSSKQREEARAENAPKRANKRKKKETTPEHVVVPTDDATRQTLAAIAAAAASKHAEGEEQAQTQTPKGSKGDDKNAEAKASENAVADAEASGKVSATGRVRKRVRRRAASTGVVTTGGDQDSSVIITG